MRNRRGLARLGVALALVAATATSALAAPREIAQKTSYSIDYTDIWWNPSQSGWGLQMVQTGSFIYATIYVYGADGKPTWFGGGLTANAGGSFSGALYVTTGPYFGGPFNPAAVTVREAGTMSFSPANVSSGLFTYTVDGVAVAKAIQRQPLTTDNYNGTYSAVATQTISGCNDPTKNGTVTSGLQVDITQNGQAMTVKLTNPNASTCTSTGAYSQLGRMGKFTGPYSCTSGQVGTLTLSEMNNVPYMFTAVIQTQSSNVGCAADGEIAGVIPR